jgi:DNA polymerase (family 10)
MTNKEIARALQETASLIELTGGNPYRARALSAAARTLRGLDESAADRLADGTLTEIDGIGDGLAAQIGELLDRGSFELRDDLLNAVPAGLLDVLRVKGLGTKKVRTLWDELGITTLDELEDAAAAGAIEQLDGFGAKTQSKILHNVKLLRRYSTRRRYADVHHDVQPLLSALRTSDAVKQADLTGALRRKLETVKAATLIVASDGAGAVQDMLSERGIDTIHHDDDDTPRLDGTLPDGLPLHVWVAPPTCFGTTQWRTTGSDAHHSAFIDAHGEPDTHADEAAVYESAGLPFIEPELREGEGELDAATNGALPTLITEHDLRGSLHNHSTYSDGAHSLRQMAEAARNMGLSYFGICDHSQSLTIANGLAPERVRQQQAEIDVLNEEFAADDGPPFRIFSGIESDILRDGALDYSEDVLASFDFVVASVHSGFSMRTEEATTRLVRAIENPYTTILGHATGRLLLVREGYTIDHERVIQACAANDVAIELNANPHRLDMDWRWIRTATEQGVLIAINPDAHATEELYNVRWGVDVARKGWLTAEQCLNAKSLDAFSDWLDARRVQHAA